MPRKYSKSKSSSKRKEVDTGVTQIPTATSGTSSIRTTKSRTSKRKATDTESWVDSHLNVLIEVFNLDTLGLTNDEARTIAIKLVDMLRGESATISEDTIRRRALRYSEHVRQLIAQTLLELREELSQQQLEFVANNIGDAVLGYAPRLYREALRYGREDLLDILRVLWRNSWVARKYPMLPVECPYCRFSSLTPDLWCMVCDAVVDEKTLKKHVNFEKLLHEFVKQYSEEEVKKAIMYGYVYLNSLGLKPPTHELSLIHI